MYKLKEPSKLSRSFIMVTYFHYYSEGAANAQVMAGDMRFEVDMSVCNDDGEFLIEAKIFEINDNEECYEDSQTIYLRGDKITPEVAEQAVDNYLY